MSPTFHATLRTGRRVEDRLLLITGVVANEFSRAVQIAAEDAALIFTSYAPAGVTGRLGRGIRVISAQGRMAASGRFATGRQFAVIASARNRDGFDYVGVTRFGHRTLFIRPSASRAPASVVSTKKSRRRFGEGPAAQRPALAILARGGKGSRLRKGVYSPYLFRQRVRGTVVARDWAAAAHSAVEREVEAQAQKLATRIERAFG